jgi:hypothetical protein
MRQTAGIVVALLIWAVPSILVARFLNSWPYQEMFAKSDFVVIAKPAVATRDTVERTTIQSYAFAGVVTEFETLLVLKGSGSKRFVLHHYRETEPSVNGPTTMTFDPQKHDKPYLLFLVRESDGRFAPVAGQIDLDFSVQELSGVPL